jgi:predicted regulator of Ras-like GTPase activity (Roadblock/LC7/MglB family)
MSHDRPPLARFSEKSPANSEFRSRARRIHLNKPFLRKNPQEPHNPISLGDELESQLHYLRSAIPDFKGALIASADGMPIAHLIADGDPNRIAAMMATAMGLSKRICQSMEIGEFAETSVSGNVGIVFAFSAGNRGVLAILAGHGANVGLIHIEAREVARKIEKLLG